MSTQWSAQVRIVALVLFAAFTAACSGGADSGSDSEGERAASVVRPARSSPVVRVATPAPAAETAPETAAPDTATPSTATPSTAAPDTATPGTAFPLSIAHTEGAGITVRIFCKDDAAASPAGEGVPDGVAARRLSNGTDECRGWALVETERGQAGWVRLRYLVDPDLMDWDGAVNATWGDFVATMDAGEQACAFAAIEATGGIREAELARPLMAFTMVPWEPEIMTCMKRSVLVGLGTAWLWRGVDETAITANERSCMRSFVAEIASINPRALIDDIDVSSEVMVALGRVCAVKAVTRAALFRALEVVGDTSDSARACIRALPLDHDLTDAPASEAWTFSTLVACAPDAMAGIMIEQLTGTEPTSSAVQCFRDMVDLADVLAAIDVGSGPTFVRSGDVARRCIGTYRDE